MGGKITSSQFREITGKHKNLKFEPRLRTSPLLKGWKLTKLQAGKLLDNVNGRGGERNN